MATFVLIHGAWHGGWCWAKVRPRLEAAGHTVYTPTLTGLGERAHLLHAGIGLDTHVEDICRVLDLEDLRGVILVGHSYGGFLVSAVAARLPERLAHRVYLDAFVPEAGQSLLELVTEDTRLNILERAQAEGDGWRSPPLPLARWGVTAPEDVAWMAPRLGAQPLKSFSDKLVLRGALPEGLPRTYISCAVSQKPHYTATARRVRELPGWNYRELPTGHDAMVTMPIELAALLIEAAAT